jgi:hypothetical protein
VKKLGQHQDKIQCIVGNVDIATVKIGQTQTPALGDYADRVDIMKFLEGLHHGF